MSQLSHDEYEFSSLPIIQIDIPTDVTDHNDIYFKDIYFNDELRNTLFLLYNESKWSKKYKNSSKINKYDSIDIFYEFEKKLDAIYEINKLKMYEKFIIISEFMGFDYQSLYLDLSVKYKEIILKEVSQDFNRNVAIKQKRLF